MATAERTRSQVRGDLPVAVRVICGPCGALLAELYGPSPRVDWPDPPPVSYWSRTAAGALPAVGRAVRWTCRAGHVHPIRGETLTAAWTAALAGGEDRIIAPTDLHRAHM